MNDLNPFPVFRFLVFHLDDRLYALPLNVVERVVRAVETTHLPGGPDIVLGMIDLAGRLLPVLNVRRRFGLPEREISPNDQFLIAQAGPRSVTLVIDAARGIVERDAAEIVGPARIVPGLERIQGVIKLDDGLVLIHDLEKFLSLDEACALDEAMRLGGASSN